MAHSKHVSGKRGGDIGFVTQKQYKVLTDVAFTMKPGEISKPFKTPDRVDHHQGDGICEEAGHPHGRRDQTSTGTS